MLDVHKGEILQMTLHRAYQSKELRLVTVCTRGTLAEWDPTTQELMGVYDLAIGEGRLKLCVMNKKYVATLQATEFKVFDMATKQLIGSFPKPVSNFGVSTIAMSRRAETLAFTQGKIIYLKDLATFKSNADFV